MKKEDHCLIGSTKVNTVDGYIQIKDLVDKSGMIYTVDSSGNKCVRKFSDVRCTRENAKVIKLVFENGGEVVCTPDHAILTSNGWIESQDITEDIDVVTLKGTTRLVSILDFGVENVYNMEVEDTHCFAVSCGDIIVHNCQDAARYALMWLQPKNKITKAGINIGI